jgi:hypothetical protein
MKSEKTIPDWESLIRTLRTMTRTDRNIPLNAEEVAAIKPGELIIPRCAYPDKSAMTHRPNRSEMNRNRKHQRRMRVKGPDGHVPQYIISRDKAGKMTVKTIWHYKNYSGGR